MKRKGDRKPRKGCDPALLTPKILDALESGDSSTPDLAKALKQDRDCVYRCCCRMEDRDELASKLVPGPPLPFCIDHWTVVNAAIYPVCKKDKHQIRYIRVKIRIWHRRLVAKKAA